ncbi:MAG: ABC transporter permease [Clostridium sp.]|uniref:ABC transporter permease n=1 Tax=Clostridium sp. TaxID=1506 RepID=UPI003EE56AE3
MDNIALALAGTLTIIPIYISYKEKLLLGKDLIISIGRAIIQLLIVGYLLSFIFEIESYLNILAIVIIMILNAGINIKCSVKIKDSMKISAFSIGVGTIITLGILIITKAINFKANEIIPIAGMIISNIMVAISLGYRSLENEFKNRRLEVETKIALGATVKEAAADILKTSIKIGVIPTIEGAKTLGIISLPGMMTGLILGGVSPIIAVKYQIMVIFMIVASTFIGILCSIYLGYKVFFNKRGQLKGFF